MPSIRLANLVAAVSASLMMAACSTVSTPRTDAQYSDDAAVNTNVQAAVTAVPGIHANTMHVTTYNGIVTLRGTAESQTAAQNAVDAARHVPGVDKVDFDIKVD